MRNDRDLDPPYASESRAFDAEILGVVDAWHRTGASLDEPAFSDLALRLFDYQFRYNRPYARYCSALGVSPAAPPRSWRDVPAVPAAAFKEARLATFDSGPALTFATSGTTGGRTGLHYLETSALYDAALLAAFDRFVLTDGARLRYLHLVPNPAERATSSLGYMMRRVALARGDSQTGWYLDGEELRFDAFAAGVRAAIDASAPVCIAATAFALVHVLDRMDGDELTFRLPAGSRVMETGGFKGRTRVLERADLYRRLARNFGLRERDVVAEYGMTELASQYYDDVFVRPDAAPRDARLKVAPPWLCTRVVGADGTSLPNGTVGALVHVDLANRSSCIAVATEDLGAWFDAAASPDGTAGLLLLGRERGSAMRGCSLDAETLRAR